MNDLHGKGRLHYLVQAAFLCEHSAKGVHVIQPLVVDRTAVQHNEEKELWFWYTGTT